MNLNIFTLLLLPSVIYAEIDVIIDASHYPSKSQINTRGVISNVVRYFDIQAFKLHDRGLKYALSEYFGVEPDDGFLTSPTPWGDLYKRYHWPEVNIAITVQNATTTAPIINSSKILRETYSNKDMHQNATVKVNMNYQVYNTMKLRWKVAPLLATNENIRYRINVDTDDNLTYEMKFAEKWDEDAIKSQHINIGTRGFRHIELEPNQTVHVELHATTGFVEVEVDYEASLYGSVVANFEHKHKGHHFHSLPVDKVMDAAGLRSSLKYKQYIDLDYYIRCRLEIKDPETNELLKIIDLFVC